MQSKICTLDYGAGQAVSIKAKDACNWLIHSYVWSLVYHSNRAEVKGFLIASDFDKEKFVHFVSFDEWQKLLKQVIENKVV